MKRFLSVIPVAATAVAVGVLAAGPASAATIGDGDVYAKVTLSGSGNGGSVSSHINFYDRNTVVFENFKVNDVCPADGYAPTGYIVVKFGDGTSYQGPGHTDDTTCDSGTGVNFGNLSPTTSKHIVEAWVKVCENGSCATSAHLGNPY